MSFTYKNLFSLVTKSYSNKTYVNMQVLCGIHTTKNLPHTRKTLKKMLPSIFYSTCYNDENLPFSREMQDTEIGHLYEHILLELLAMYKREKTRNIGNIQGITEWNWKNEPKGTFHIHISVGKKDEHLLFNSIKRANEIMEQILLSQSITHASSTNTQ